MAVRIARRAFVKIFGIVGFLLALVGGVIIGYSALVSGGLSPTSLITRAVEALLGLAAVVAGVIMYTGPMRFGGVLAAFSGILLLILTTFEVPAILVFAAGIVGIVGAAIKPPWWKFWKR